MCAHLRYDIRTQDIQAKRWPLNQLSFKDTCNKHFHFPAKWPYSSLGRIKLVTVLAILREKLEIFLGTIRNSSEYN